MSFGPELEKFGMPELGPGLSLEVLQKRIDDLQKETQEHKGEVVLVVRREWVPAAWDLPEERTPYSLETRYKLGIISSSLRIEKKEYVKGRTSEEMKLDTSKYLEFSDTSYQVPPIVEKKGEIVNDFPEALDMLSKRVPAYNWEAFPEKILEIIVGDDDVSQWIETKVKRKSHASLDLQSLLLFEETHKILGKNLRLSPEGEALAKEELNKATAETVKSIYELLSKENLLLRDIENIFDIAKHGGIIREQAGVTLVEDEDDAKVISFGQRQHVRLIRRQLESIISRAFNLGMHEVDMVIENELIPGHKEVIDVKRLIRGLCEKYEIPIPN